MLIKRNTSFSVPLVIVLLFISTVLTMTMSQVANAQQTPVRIIRFENIGNSANVNIGVSPDTHHCVATGWSAKWDIDEDFDGSNHVWTHVQATTAGNRWFVRVAFNNDGDTDKAENPDVDVVCFPTNVATFEGNKFLYDPD
jgi:hypothetical protein